ncbi:hypothetical protein K0M31_002175 [Melipona bicolor]|uniref:Uncharacterized protein n=1 Tax=Melipona bicolor TaxID=60889 RepID=A0AA40GH26_9HYME|nr:hypothetical protein K0M31_002175 [Melipona bicolor]
MLNVIPPPRGISSSTFGFPGLKGSRSADRSNSARVDGCPLTYPRRGTLPGLFTAWNFQFKLEFRAKTKGSSYCKYGEEEETDVPGKGEVSVIGREGKGPRIGRRLIGRSVLEGSRDSGIRLHTFLPGGWQPFLRS